MAIEQPSRLLPICFSISRKGSPGYHFVSSFIKEAKKCCRDQKMQVESHVSEIQFLQILWAILMSYGGNHILLIYHLPQCRYKMLIFQSMLQYECVFKEASTYWQAEIEPQSFILILVLLYFFLPKLYRDEFCQMSQQM